MIPSIPPRELGPKIARLQVFLRSERQSNSGSLCSGYQADYAKLAKTNNADPREEIFSALTAWGCITSALDGNVPFVYRSPNETGQASRGKKKNLSLA